MLESIVLHLTSRRVFAGTVLTLVAAMAPGLVSSSAQASTSTVNVVGTSDVFDSNLIQSVIAPGFEAAYPGTTLNYISKGTGAAITYAEAGTADALLVHAASVENQFVADGFSLEKYGRAIFWGDYVLLGPASDPAGVMTGTSHEDIAQAFKKIATAGAAGHADFVSRSGSPGTTVQEHAIWALTSGVTGCHVTDANGGGFTPSTTPDDGTGHCPSSISYPSWYHSANLTQAPNIEAADTCNFPNASSGNDCYVFTDRGTFEYLESTHAISTMQIVVNDNHLAPATQQNLLVNSFHLYGINPAAVPSGSTINTVGATELLNWLTSPAAQRAVGKYLESNGNAPFRPDAAPMITATKLPASVTAGDVVTIKGTVANVVPGTPALNGVSVHLLKSAQGTTSIAAKTTTDATGHYVFHYKPVQNATYSVVTPALTKVEVPTLSPIFADLLQPSSTELTKIYVKAVPTLRSAVAQGHRVAVRGLLSPKVVGGSGAVVLWGAHPGKPIHQIAVRRLAPGARGYNTTFQLGKGVWRLRIHYRNPGVIRTGATRTLRVTIG